MITHELKLDMIPNMSKNEVWVNQYDTDFLIRITLFASKGTFSVETGTTAAIRGTKPDGNGYSANASVSGNVVTVTGAEQMTVVSGRSVYELTLYKDGKELSTVNFNLRVERAALDKDTPTSKSQTRELVDIEEHADEIIAAVENMEGYAEDSEAYAVGTRGGVAVESGDPAYENNAKYWAEHASGENLASQFSASTAYAVGDYVLYNNQLYRFTTAHPAGAWNAAHATAVTMGGEVADLKEDLSETVKFTEQTLTDAQKAQVKENIGVESAGGLSNEAKVALLQCFENVTWKNAQGQNYYNALSIALYGGQRPDTYPGIIATFDPGVNVIYTDDALSALKAYLTVVYYETASSNGIILSDGDYTLTGTLSTGLNQITANYNNLTSAFSVEAVDFYNIWNWSTEFSGVGKLIKSYNVYDQTWSGVVRGFRTVSDSTRFGICTNRGKQPAIISGTSTLSDRYPIPIPETAEKATITNSRSSDPLYGYIGLYSAGSGPSGNGFDYRILNAPASWNNIGTHVVTFTPQANLFLGYNGKKSDNSAFTQEERDNAIVTVTFE